MKFKIYLVAILTIIFTGCADNVDLEQPGRLDPNAAFRTVDDLQSGLFGVYAILDNTLQTAFTTQFTDEAAPGIDNGGQGGNFYDFLINTNSGIVTGIWSSNYSMINLANRVLEGAALITPTPEEQDEYDAIVGQLHALRAIGHWELLIYFTEDIRDDAGNGVINVDFVPQPTDRLPRNTTGETMAFIQEDLATAEGLLAGFDDGVTFLSVDAIRALRARIAAYRGDYPTADALAQSLLTEYPIATRAQFPGVFTDDNNSEVIFKMERTIGDNRDTQATDGGGWIGSLWSFVNATRQGGPFLEMDRSLFNSFDADDVRLDAYIAADSDIDPNWDTNPSFINDDVLVVAKHPGSENQPLMNDIKYLRSSELLLIRAEAAAFSNNFNGAANSTAAFIKELRDNRYSTPQPLPNYATQAAALADLLDERKKEFAFEGHRYQDLKRLGPVAGVGIERNFRDCAINGQCALPATDFRFTLPIPQAELNANPSIVSQQNTGY